MPSVQPCLYCCARTSTASAEQGQPNLPANLRKREPKSVWVWGVAREAKEEAGVYEILISQC